MNNSRETTTHSHRTSLLVAICFGAVLLYVYFLNMSVVHVVVQKETMRDIQVLKNDIALLEANYIEAQHAITARMATIEGVSAERNKIFVSRGAADSLVVNQ